MAERATWQPLQVILCPRLRGCLRIIKKVLIVSVDNHAAHLWYHPRNFGASICFPIGKDLEGMPSAAAFMFEQAAGFSFRQWDYGPISHRAFRVGIWRWRQSRR